MEANQNHGAEHFTICAGNRYGRKFFAPLELRQLLNQCPEPSRYRQEDLRSSSRIYLGTTMDPTGPRHGLVVGCLVSRSLGAFQKNNSIHSSQTPSVSDASEGDRSKVGGER